MICYFDKYRFYKGESQFYDDEIIVFNDIYTIFWKWFIYDIIFLCGVRHLVGVFIDNKMKKVFSNFLLLSVFLTFLILNQ